MTRTGGESHSLAQAKAELRDDGGSTPYRDTTGEQAVWNLLLSGVKFEGIYRISGPHGLLAEISPELLASIKFRREPSRRRKDRLVAYLDHS